MQKIFLIVQLLLLSGLLKAQEPSAPFAYIYNDDSTKRGSFLVDIDGKKLPSYDLNLYNPLTYSEGFLKN